MSSLINLSKHLKPQGLQTGVYHEGVVVDNKDPRKLCRIRARVTGLFDGIPDDCLPWAVPLISSVDGNYIDGWNSEKSSKPQDRSGTFYVPTQGSKIFLMFMGGDPHFPVWLGYTGDDKVTLKDELSGPEDHYPERAVFRMRGGMYLIVDSKAKEVFINSPYDVYLTILGDVHETIVGNSTTLITGSTALIPNYVKYAPASRLDLMASKVTTASGLKVPWAGEPLSHYRVGGGNRHVYVEGDETVVVGGNRNVVINGNDLLTINRNKRTQVRGTAVVNAQMIMHQEG